MPGGCYFKVNYRSDDVLDHHRNNTNRQANLAITEVRQTGLIKSFVCERLQVLYVHIVQDGLDRTNNSDQLFGKAAGTVVQ